MNDIASPPTNKGGRPARLSRSAIVERTLEMIEQDGFDPFSMPRLAASFGVSTMAIYKHFANREAVLSAVVDTIVDAFDYVDRNTGWEGELAYWFDCFFHLFERYPIAVRLLKWERSDATYTGWLRVWAPLTVILKRSGLSNKQLSFAVSWTITASIGLVTVHSSPHRRAKPPMYTLFSQPTGDAEADAALVEAGRYFGQHGRKIMDFGAHWVIESIRSGLHGPEQS